MSLPYRRDLRAIGKLAMVTALLWLTCGELALAGDGGTWSEGSSMFKSRSYHAATLLLNGKVLITGGFEPTPADPDAYNIDQAELYDPATGKSSFEGKLTLYRSGHTATLLPDGRVLVAGGFADRNALTDAEIYDPSCSEPPQNGSPASDGGVACAPWAPIRPMKYPRAAHTATLLRDGKVLVVGGVSTSLPPPPPEVYDPATGEWTETAALENGIRAFHTATLLQDGRVLVLGGGLIALGGAGFTEFNVTLNGEPFFSLPFSIYAKALNSAWLYNPNANTWNKLDAGLMDTRIGHTATLMPDGKVLVMGGWKPQDETTKITLELAGMTTDGGMALSSSELYDPVNQRFEPAGAENSGSESSGRAGHTATLLPDGRVLVIGGSSGETILNTTSVYNPNPSATNRWSPATPLPESRSLHTATLLPGGRVLVTGGYRKDPAGTRVTFKSILYDANTSAWSSAGSMIEPRGDFTSTLLPDGRVLVAGGRSQTTGSGSPLPSAELYTSSHGSTGSAALTSSLQVARYGHSATLLPDGKVLVAGGFSSAGEQQPLGSVEVYDPAISPPSWTRIQTEMQSIRGAHTATLLSTGRVLVVGGRSISGTEGSSEEYDIAAQSWDGSSRRDMGARCENHTATLLQDGTVLVAGGKESLTFNSTSMLYDPFTKNWTSTANTLAQPRYSHTATLLTDGKVLVAGGYSDIQPLGVSELYDPSIKRWIPSSRMMTRRALHAAVLLPTGQVLVTGGRDETGTPLASAELYDPTTNSWSEAPALDHARASHSMVALPDGNVLVLGGTDSMGVLSSAELYSVPRSGPFEPPLISEVEPFNDLSQNSFEPGTALTVTGERFRSGSEASGGGTSSSAVNFPLLRLRSFETGQWITPQGQKWSTHLGQDLLDTSATVPLPPQLPDGHYLLNVTSSGQSTSKVILLRNLTLPDTFFTSPSELPSEEPAASVSFQFSSSDADVRSYECSLDGADFTPCTSPHSVANLDFTTRTFRVRARDLANNVDPTPAEHTWHRPKLSHYGWNCSAGGDSLWLAGPWALLLLGLRRCRRPR